VLPRDVFKYFLISHRLPFYLDAPALIVTLGSPPGIGLYYDSSIVQRLCLGKSGNPVLLNHARPLTPLYDVPKKPYQRIPESPRQEFLYASSPPPTYLRASPSCSSSPNFSFSSLQFCLALLNDRAFSTAHSPSAYRPMNRAGRYGTTPLHVDYSPSYIVLTTYHFPACALCTFCPVLSPPFFNREASDVESFDAFFNVFGGLARPNSSSKLTSINCKLIEFPKF